jgi:hypothetical protein
MNKTRSGLLWGLVAAGMMVSCGGPSQNVRTSGAESLGEQALGLEVIRDPQACSGELVPPTGYHQEAAYEPLTTRNAREVAIERARTRLRERLCQGFRCEQVDSAVQTWRVAEDGRQVCVMAVASRQRVAALYAEPRQELEKALATMAGDIARAARSVSDNPVIVIDTITDNGVNGGQRAEWLHGLLLTALGQAGVRTAPVPERWSGLGLPPGVDAVVRSQIVMLPGQETMLEASVRAELAETVRGVGSVQFPQAIAPAMDTETYLPPLPRGTGKVALHMDTRPGGALCHGQNTELWLEASEPLYLRVINLYGKGDGALVVYSTGEETLPINRPISLGAFQAIKATDVPVERFLVVASPTLEGLERFEEIRGACRLPATMARELNLGRNLPAATYDYVTSTDYRLMGGEECAAYSNVPEGDLSAVSRLPACW